MPSLIARRIALPRLLALVLSQRFANGAHAVAQGVHGIGLTINRLRHIAITQGLFRPVHRAFGAVQ